MKKLSLLFLIFSLLIYFTGGFSYSQQPDRRGDSAAPVRAASDVAGKSGEGYLKYEGPDIAPMPNMFSASLRMITVLLVLLTLFFAVIFFLKKFQQRKGIQNKGPISVLFQLPVGSREYVCLVDVMGEILVLGVTSAQISLLCKVEDAGTLKSLTESQTYSGHQFANYLKSEQENIKVAALRHQARKSDDVVVSSVLESLRTLRDKLKKI